MSLRKLSFANDYQVTTAIFEGPLYILLELIERAELDITTLSLAKVTDQFLDYLHKLSNLNADIVSSFLVIAAKLLQIKSSALLPRSPHIDLETEEDPGEALVRQLIEYKKYKDIANLLEIREKTGLKTYLRLVMPEINIEPKVDLNDFDLSDLHASAQEILYKDNGLLPLDEVVSLPRITVREKIESIIKRFQKQQLLSFSSLLETQSRIEIVVTFLAVLELIKQNMLEVTQEKSFADIQLHPKSDKLEKSELEIEF